MLAAAGKENREIATQVGLSIKSVSLWRNKLSTPEQTLISS
ncbi:MAG: hypothetical protein FJ126_10140 [Deltaproteobacteria bacterium]|nr:hypothetical protein [Deltaproteobacteria bacterium]